MARSCARLTALGLLLAACGGGGGEEPSPDAPSPFCAASAECGAGSWCNPLGMLCEPRRTTYQFERDIYPQIQSVCAGCHVPGVPDPQGSGNIVVFAGGQDVAYLSLVEGGTNCLAEPHRLCVNEPVSSLAVMRILVHRLPNQTLLLPDGYADPWMQKLLHWIAAGAQPTASLADGGIVDAPPTVIDAPPTVIDAPPTVFDAPPPPPVDAPPQPDAAPLAPGRPVITSPASGASTGPTVIPVTWTAAAPNGSPITQYAITARRVSTGAPTTVTCNAPFSDPPCQINGDQSISTTVTGLVNCAAYDVTVTATNAGGSTVSDPVTNVTPRQAPSVPTLAAPPVTKVAGSVGELLFDWNPSNANSCGVVSYTVELTPPPGFVCGTPIPTSPCHLSAGTTTSFNMTTSVPACPYPSVNCNNPRTWSFRVRAANLGGTSGFSSSASGTPRIGYTRDTIPTIWTTNFGGITCVGCHVAGNVLDLTGTAAAQWNELRNNTQPPNTPGVVVVGSPGTSLLHLCPTQSPGCNTFNGFTSHPGGQRYLSGSREDNVIVQWILDGALF